MTNARKSYGPGQKAQVALEAYSGRYTTAQLSARHGVHGSLINRWVRILKEQVSTLYEDKRSKKDQDTAALIQDLYQKIGQQNIELDWLKKKSQLLSRRP